MASSKQAPKQGSWRNYNICENQDHVTFTHDQWYSAPVDGKRLKKLMKRRDAPGLINFSVWLVLTVTSGIGAYIFIDSWLAVPLFAIYGVLYASGSESRWHECSHGTAFRTTWMNECFYHLCSFMTLKNPYLWRWSHVRHHTDTLIVGRDPEIAFPRPPSFPDYLLNLLHLKAGFSELQKMVRCALGKPGATECDYLNKADYRKTFWTSRVHLLILLATVTTSVLLESWLPVLYIGLPTFYGSWLHNIMGSLQHAGLAEDVPDHRLNCRTVYMNPVLRFIYSNMNYHLEHHMFPMVPFYSLPALHEEVKPYAPPAYPGLFAGLKEVLYAMWKQQKDPHFYIKRTVPEQVQPQATPT